jgi:hypothetical protein
MDCRAQKTYHGIVGLESPGLTKGTAITWPDRNPHGEKQKNKTPHPTNQQKQTTPPPRTHQFNAQHEHEPTHQTPTPTPQKPTNAKHEHEEPEQSPHSTPNAQLSIARTAQPHEPANKET